MADPINDGLIQQPSRAWAALGLPGALIAEVVARRRHATLPRHTWAAAWVVTGAVAVLGLVLSLVVRPPSPQAFVGVSSPSITGTPDTPLATPSPTSAEAPFVSIDATDTAQWQDDQGYSFEATVSLGRVAPYQPGMTLSVAGSQVSLRAGSACQLNPDVDALISGELVARNTTATFTADVQYSLIYRVYHQVTDVGATTDQPVWLDLGRRITDPAIWTEVQLSSGPICADSTSAVTEGPNVTCSHVARWQLLCAVAVLHRHQELLRAAASKRQRGAARGPRDIRGAWTGREPPTREGHRARGDMRPGRHVRHPTEGTR